MRSAPSISAWTASLALGAMGAAGLLPAAGGAGDPTALASWLAWTAPALGVLAGARRSRLLLLLPPALWLCFLAASGAARRGGGLPSPLFAWVAVAGLYALGAAVGAVLRPPAIRGAALVLLLTGLLTALPTGGGALARPWPPPVAARLLDLSPVGFVLESGGVDWMRSPAIYAGADTASIGPDLRTSRAGGRAAPVLLFVAYASVVALWALRGRRGAQEPRA